MADSKQTAIEKRTASHRLGITGAVALAASIVAGAAAYLYETPFAWPVAVACLIVALCAFTLSVVVKKRTALRGRMGSFLQAELGPSWNPDTDLKRATKYVDGAPQDVTFAYPKGLPDHDGEWRDKMETMVRQRMGTGSVKADWNTKRSQVRMRGFNIVVSALDKAREQIVSRTYSIFKPLFRGVELNLSVASWDKMDELQPRRIELSYGVTALDGSELWQRKLEAMAGLKIGGRWRGTFDPTKDEGYLEPRPELPKLVIHSGAGLYSNLSEADIKSPTLYYGVDENGIPRGWTIGKKSTMPHMLIIGPTGGGKTTVLRSLVMGAVAQGIPVFACDPKMIELTPFYGFPGVWIGSTAPEMSSMIEAIENLMYERYDAIKKNPRAAEGMTPVLFVLDELLILRQVLKRYWAKEGGKDGKKGTGQPPWFEAIAGLLALARSAMINVVIGVQRPDATLFDDGARDNLRQRLSLMRLSAQGSQMLWGSGFVGVDLPMIQGRAMASPDGENPIEMQTFWLADPVTAEGADKAVIDSFKAMAETKFADYKPPFDVSAYEGDMPHLDLDTLPRSLADMDLGADESVTQTTEDSVTQYDSQRVKADTLTVGDKIILDSGEVVEVLEVDEDPFDDDAVAITVETMAGVEGVSFPRSENVARAVDLIDA